MMKDLKKEEANGMVNSEIFYDVIVVGAGMAGLTGAAYLTKAGYTTLLCEKSDQPGGLVGSFTRQGYTFDAGIRAFENSGIVFPMLKQLGISLDFVKNPVVIGLEETQMTLEGVESLSAYGAMLSAKFPENQGEIAAIIAEIRKVTGWYLDFKSLCQEQILAVLDNSLFPGLTEQVELCFVSTPVTIEQRTGNLDGAITGWAFGDAATSGELPAVSLFRKIAKSIETPLPHVHQAGQWTFSPSGMPVSILTGKLAADGVIKQLVKQGHGGHSDPDQEVCR